MTEEIKLGVYERLLNDYESDKEKYAADLAYAACCLVDTVTSEEIARNENAVTFAVGLPLALSWIDEEIWKTYLAKPANEQEKLKEFLEGVDVWNRGNLSEDSDFDRLLKVCESLDDNWYSKYFAWFKFCCIEADFENNKDNTEKWLKEASSLWEQAKSDRFKTLLCLNAFFYGVDDKGNYADYSLYLEKPSKKSKEPRQQSFYLAQKIIEDSIKIFTAEKKQDPFGLFLLGVLLESADWDEPPNCKYIFELCINGMLSRAAIHLVGLLDEDEQEYYQEAFKWYEKGAKLGCPYTQGALAYLYEGNEGVLQDLSKARDWRLKALTGLERLGNKDDFIAMTVIAGYYANGAEGIPVNTSEALKWYKRALPIAEKHKDTESQQKILIGIYEIYSNNQEWKDMKKLESEAQSGDTSAAAAMQAIGDLYLKGDTCPQDLNESCKWYKKAAEHLKMPFFVLGIENYEEYMDVSSKYLSKTDKVFGRTIEKALELDIIHTDEFFNCYKYIPDYSNDADVSAKAKKLITLLHDCFDKYDPKFAIEMEEIIGDSHRGFYNAFALGSRKEIREYLKELLIMILKESPHELKEFLRRKGGKLDGFGLAQFSELCILLRPDVYFVLNRHSHFSKMAKKNKDLYVKDTDYTNYPSLCEKLISKLQLLGFSGNSTGHIFDRFFCDHSEEHGNLIENFQVLVRRLLGIVENNSTTEKEAKAKLRRPSDAELQELIKEFMAEAEQHYSGEHTIKALADEFKLFLEGRGYCYEPEYENKLREYLKNE